MRCIAPVHVHTGWNRFGHIRNLFVFLARAAKAWSNIERVTERCCDTGFGHNGKRSVKIQAWSTMLEYQFSTISS